MKFNIVKRCEEDLTSIGQMLKSFLPYSRKRVGFDKPPTIYFQSDDANAKRLLGKTAHYDPQSYAITVYVTGRHPKDVMRSLSHELVHHGQNCRGEFGNLPDTTPGYAQNNSHLRDMEVEAYREGNLCFRDWEDDVKTRKIEIPDMLRENILNTLGDNNMNTKQWKDKTLNSLLMEKFGYGKKCPKCNKVACVCPINEEKHAEGGDNVKHKVISGETLSKIAKDHGVTVKAIKSLNNLDSDTIKVGQVLRIPMPVDETVKNPGKHRTGMEKGYDDVGDGVPDGADSDPKVGSKK